MTVTEHTPAPWRFRMMGSEGARIMPDSGNIREDGKYIARVDGRDFHADQSNAEFIVHAVNAHDKLVEALEKITVMSLKDYGAPNAGALEANRETVNRIARAALALARGEAVSQ